MITRRGVLAGAGGVVVLGAAARAVDQGLVFDLGSPGLKAWDDWRLRRYQGALALVSAGLLAASPHNSQPWRFALGRLGVDVFEVPERGLGAMDPFGRERLIGLGAAMHNMALAASSIGRAARVAVLPDAANPEHVARIELGPEGGGVAPHPLLDAMAARHTHRGAWTGAGLRPIEMARVRDFPLAPGLSVTIAGSETPWGRDFAAQTLAATRAITDDAAMSAAGHAWFRQGRRALDASKDGLGLATAGLSPGLAFAAAMLPAQSAADAGRYWLAATRDTVLPSASAFGAIAVAAPWDRRSALLVGMAWQRLHLQATALGLVAQPLNQVPEMIDREQQLGRQGRFAQGTAQLVGTQQLMFGFRLGHAAAAPASVRRPVSLVMGAPARIGYDVDRARAETLAQDAMMAQRRR